VESLLQFGMECDEVSQRFGTQPLRVVITDERGLFDATVQETLHKLADVLSEVEGVREVRSPFNTQVITGTETTITVRAAAPGSRMPASSEDQATFQGRVSEHGEGSLSAFVSADFTSVALLVEHWTDEDPAKLLHRICAAVDSVRGSVDRIAVYGTQTLSTDPYCLQFDPPAPNLSFTGRVTVWVEVDTQIRDGLKEISVLRAMADLQDYATSLGASQTSSLADLVREMHRAFYLGDPAEYRLPESTRTARQLLLLYTFQGGEIGRCAIGDFSTGLVTMTLDVASCDELRRLLEKIDRWIGDHFDKDVDVRIQAVGAEVLLDE